MRPLFSIALLASTILYASLVTAAEPTTAPPKQITNSIGMKLTLVPSGEFMMGSKESAEETAAFFNKTTARIFWSRRFEERASAAPRADYAAVLPGHLSRHAGPIPAVCR